MATKWDIRSLRYLPWSWKGSSDNKMPTGKAWGPEFNPWNPCGKARHNGTHLWSEHWESKARGILGGQLASEKNQGWMVLEEHLRLTFHLHMHLCTHIYPLLSNPHTQDRRKDHRVDCGSKSEGQGGGVLS